MATSPFVVGADVEIAAGEVKQPSMEKLAGVFDVPSRIDEIRFQIIEEGDAVDPEGYLGSFARVKLQVAGKTITNGFVPINCLSPVIQGYTELWGEHSQLDKNAAFYRWKLPRPLYLPAGVSIVPAFNRTDSRDSVNAATFAIAYAGVLFDHQHAAHKKADLPYVTAYQPAQGVSGISSELDLGNGLSVPVNMERFVGRLETINSVSSVDPTISTTAMIKMMTKGGQTVIRDFTPFHDVFAFPRRAWEFKSVLQPGDGFYAQLQALSASERATVALIGWREETI